MSQSYQGKLHEEQASDFFFAVVVVVVVVVILNFQLSAQHFFVPPRYFLKREDNVEKR